MLQAGIEAFGQADVRAKILFTLGMLIVFRFVAHIPVPGVDGAQLQQTFDQNAVLGFLNIFSGGALENLSVAALGVYPYITATIVMQLATPLIPRLQSLAQEGEAGRQQVQRYTHYMTVPLAAFQGYAQLLLIQQLGGISNVGFTGDNALPTIATLFSMVAGTMFLVWLGELISEQGIGNGVSVIILGGIVAGIPGLIGRGVLTGTGAAIGGLLLLTIIALAVVALIVMFQEAQRRIPVQYARSTFRGGRLYRQQGQSHIPLRVNSAGMIPLIFATSIMIFPPIFFQFVANTADVGWITSTADFLQAAFSPTGGVYWIGTFVLVVGFTFFYTMVVFSNQNLAENLQRQGGFIPGIRPGRPTQEYITRVLVRITWGGAIFLGLIAVLPFLATRVTNVQALQISATGLLIVVGVVIDTMRQIEAQMMMRNYEGFIS
ncbi:MAG: preprotein translocase subunit SecY [Dehalococcoidia bacterium]|nr:preprotein translocase subunit SecY [Dehalococcoidia bacterium]MCA9849548.1 preprotein translocase subunit SecY [Dehalococcoidia bacterium]MCB1733729.1 preprotein translocase subunit SecY [Gammaproteobacteria bacterium]MCB9483212.1 preprotein translocase subunit SecY [Dehalococcoidia bacterium]MCB9492354.1 preprotein translocase subunit SecY [Dehalococcoidia bacterium]